MSREKLEKAKSKWEEKLAYFQYQLSITASANQKFELQERIKECDTKIKEIETKLTSSNWCKQLYVTPQHIQLTKAFQALIEDKTKNFIGREFIFAAINDYLKDKDFPSGYILIKGEPGIGKSSIIAQLVKQQGYAHHFNIAPAGINSSRTFLENICKQLIIKYDLGYSSLPDKATENSLFLLDILREIADQETPVIILIDALDEAEENSRSNANRLYLPPDLPDGVFFIITTRTEDDIHLNVNNSKDIYLEDDDPRNLNDVRLYITNYVKNHKFSMLPRIEEWGVQEQQFIEAITERSEGNFMYIVYVLQDIKYGNINVKTVDSIHKLPKGLEGYYKRHWDYMKKQNKEEFDPYYKPVVCTLAIVKEPVSATKILEWIKTYQNELSKELLRDIKISLSKIKEVIKAWKQFLNEVESLTGEHKYRIYHTSFQEFLKEEVGLTEFHENIAQTALNKIPGFRKSQEYN
ncbi:ATP-binding protein [Moorena sp. SIO4G3]|uniref:AAA family ATPase n=1 Tax=Moorena sp. SIO4G3 TaxID=2607821 RepID=UPI001429544C|nr:ATP-binding protein [Moorena sp. SIO4G3]NEO77663.1 ATP-binding protein [Moorena sp. SIO4G3]